TALSVIRTREVEIVLEIHEEREDRAEAPQGVAGGGPAVEVLRQASQEHLAVDGARPANDLSARHEHLRGVSVWAGRETPFVVAGDDVRRCQETVADLGRQRLERRVV